MFSVHSVKSIHNVSVHIGQTPGLSEPFGVQKIAPLHLTTPTVLTLSWLTFGLRAQSHY